MKPLVSAAFLLGSASASAQDCYGDWQSAPLNQVWHLPSTECLHPIFEAWKAQHPDRVEIRAIGETATGAPMWALRLTANADTPASYERPTAMLTGAIHGGETASIRTLLDWVEFAIDLPQVEAYPGGPTVEMLLQDNQVWIVPMINTDLPGFGTVDGSRCNANDVNLNRDWPFLWIEDQFDVIDSDTDLPEVACNGNRGRTGDRPFSQPETRALAGLMQVVQPSVFLTGHGWTTPIEADPTGTCTLRFNGLDNWSMSLPASTFSWSGSGFSSSGIRRGMGVYELMERSDPASLPRLSELQSAGANLYSPYDPSICDTRLFPGRGTGGSQTRSYAWTEVGAVGVLLEHPLFDTVGGGLWGRGVSESRVRETAKDMRAPFARLIDAASNPAFDALDPQLDLSVERLSAMDGTCDHLETFWPSSDGVAPSDDVRIGQYGEYPLSCTVRNWGNTALASPADVMIQVRDATGALVAGWSDQTPLLAPGEAAVVTGTPFSFDAGHFYEVSCEVDGMGQETDAVHDHVVVNDPGCAATGGVENYCVSDGSGGWDAVFDGNNRHAFRMEMLRNTEDVCVDGERQDVDMRGELDLPSVRPSPQSDRRIEASGDFNGDGHIDLVRGFPFASDGVGRVDVHWGEPGAVPSVPTIISPLTQSSWGAAKGEFGAALEVGDFDGDGVDDLAIGAPAVRRSGRPEVGLVVVLYGEAGVIGIDSLGGGKDVRQTALNPNGRRQLLRPGSMGSGDRPRFGETLAVGNFNGDARDDLAVGGPGKRIDGTNRAGFVRVYHGSGNSLAFQRALHSNLVSPGSAQLDGAFGAALEAARLTDDTYDDLIVGAPGIDRAGDLAAGEIWFFWGTGVGWDDGGVLPSNATPFQPEMSYSESLPGHRFGAGIDLVWSGAGTGLWRNAVIDVGFEMGDICAADGVVALTVNFDGTSISPDWSDLSCDLDVCGDLDAQPGEGALPEVPVNFIVLANASTVPTGSLTDLPGPSWTGLDPITDAPIAGDAYFLSLVDLLNQQFVTEDAEAVCDGQDCVQFVYASHHDYAADLFDGDCPMLESMMDPLNNPMMQPESRFAIDCHTVSDCPVCTDPAVCPSAPYATSSISEFTRLALEQCMANSDVVSETGLNVLIYDVGGVDGTGLDYSDARGHAGSGLTITDLRRTDSLPFAFVDYARALKPRLIDVGAPAAAEDHEVAHALGLHHRTQCDDDLNGFVPTMTQSGSGCPAGVQRKLGFTVAPSTDSYNTDPIIERDRLVDISLRHFQENWCPAGY